MTCDICHGKRYNRETLDIRFKGKNIHEILQMTVEDAVEFFDAIPLVKRKLDTLMDVGLSYITLGKVLQPYQEVKHNALNFHVNFLNAALAAHFIS